MTMEQLIKDIDCSPSKKYTNRFIDVSDIDPINIEQVKKYILKGDLLIKGGLWGNNIAELIKTVDNVLDSNFDMIFDNVDITIYKPKSFIYRKKILSMYVHKLDMDFINYNLNAYYNTVYCCIIKNNYIKSKIGNYFICVVNNSSVYFYNINKINIEQSIIINFDFFKYFIHDDIDDRIKKETIQNIKLLQQEELHCDLYLYNYDYSHVEVNCRKINGNVTLITDFHIIPNFLKNIEITGVFICKRNELKNLINCPQNVHSIDCSDNKLISLKGAPIYLNGDFKCSGNLLQTLINSPRIILGTFYCNDNKISTLVGSPVQVKNINCSYNKFNSLKGLTQNVSGNIYLGYNNITSLDGLPNIINGNLTINGTKLTSLKNVPNIIKGKFDYRESCLKDNYRPYYDRNGVLINEYNNEYDNGTTD